MVDVVSVVFFGSTAALVVMLVLGPDVLVVEETDKGWLSATLLLSSCVVCGGGGVYAVSPGTLDGSGNSVIVVKYFSELVEVDGTVVASVD